MTREGFDSLPPEQQHGIRMVYARGLNDYQSFNEFINILQPEIGGYGAVMIPWAGMWLGVEKDGHTHS
jgi:hypothetical protein